MVCTGSSIPKRRAAIIASQQQPQQLQMKLTRALHVLAELDQVVVVRLLEQVRPLDPVDAPGVAVADQRVGRARRRSCRCPSARSQARPRCSILWRQ